MAIAITPVTAANANFGPLGSAAWAAGMQMTGLGTNQLLYSTGATTLGQSANLSFTDGPPRFQVGSGLGTSIGWVIGNVSASNVGTVWSTGVASPDLTNFAILGTSSRTDINAASFVNFDIAGTTQIALTNVLIDFRPNNVSKQTINATAGAGPSITAGTATTDVQALSATQTMNGGAGVNHTGIKSVATEGGSGTGAATSLIDLQYGTSGNETSQFKVRKDGLITTGGTAGVASFGPSAVTSITVKNGIITAIS